MLSNERKLRLRVIELAHKRGLLPASGAMAALARLAAECAAVRILMARLAPIKAHTGVLQFPIRLRQVARLAFHLRMRAGEWVASLSVINLRCGIPTACVVALATIRTLFSIVLVFVTRYAIACQAKIRVVCISLAQRLPFAGHDVFGRVALLASQIGVLAVENEPRLGVIEMFRVPLHQREIRTVVLAMALNARRGSWRRSDQARVIPALLLQSHGDVAMAFKTSEVWRGRGDGVALHARCRSVQVLVGLRERSGRDLSLCRQRQQQEESQQAEEPNQRERQSRRRRLRTGGLGIANSSRFERHCHQWQSLKQSRFQNPRLACANSLGAVHTYATVA